MSNVMTPIFRVSYPNVFKPKKNDLNGKDEYSIVALFKKGEDISKLKSAVVEAIEDMWGTDKTKWPKNIRTPFRDQAERAKDIDGKSVLPDGYEAGAFFLNLKSNQRPGLVDAKMQDIIDESQFYPGCFARATVNAKAYDQKGNKGVSLYLQNIQKTGEGEPLGGRMRASDEFSPIEGAADSAATSADDLFS